MNNQMMGSIGGPVGGGPQMVNNAGTPGSSAGGQDFNQRLNTHIYDYFLRIEKYDLARAVQETLPINTLGKQNGVEGDMDTDSKEGGPKRPDDLPAADVPPSTGGVSFLQDWWAQFWDMWQAHRQRASKPSSAAYIHNQMQASKARAQAQQRMLSQMGDPNVQQYRAAMMGQQPNGMNMPNDLKKAAAMNNNRTITPQQIQHMQQMRNAQQAQMMQQTQQMQRDGSQMGMSGPRSGSPGSGDAPSPKRQRMDDNNFSGPQMGPGGRGPQNNMQGQQVGATSAAAAQTAQILQNHGLSIDDIPSQQFNSMQMQPTPDQNKAAQVYSQQLQQQMKAAMNNASNLNKGVPGNPPGMPQGSPQSMAAMDGTNEFYAANGQMRGMPPGGAQNAGNNNGNHALQDYQMQLMLLEQQNKKRLLMARQEQDSMAHPAGVPGVNGAAFAPNMSPQGSRAGGPSPNPNEMQRGTPKMGKGGIPSPNGEMQGRGSPTPGFDPNQMPPNMRGQMMMGPNGQMMRPPSSSHPGFNGQPMSQQQMDMFARQQGGMLPNGTWQGGPQMMPGQQPPPQQPPNMTPQQRNAAMPPPPAPQGNAGGTQPSSPQQPAAPPTPSQANKPNPKTNKKDTKANKKTKKGSGATAATPASESEQPPTPTPATPITPMHQNSFNHQKNGQLPQNVPPAQANAVQPPPSNDMNGAAPFGSLENDQFSAMNLDFGGLDGPDVLDQFDFDSFLNTDDGNPAFNFDMGPGFDDSLQAGEA